MSLNEKVTMNRVVENYNGEENERLIDMSERTCYLHATLVSKLLPRINFKVIK